MLNSQKQGERGGFQRLGSGRCWSQGTKIQLFRMNGFWELRSSRVTVVSNTVLCT